MSLLHSTLPPALAVFAWIGILATLGWAAHTAQAECRGRPLQQHAWLGGIVAIALLWSLQLPSPLGIAFGLLGSALYALLFGRALAMLGLSAAAALVTGLNGGAWANLGLVSLMLGILPAWLATALQRQIERRLPHNLFVFIIGNGLFVALLATAATSVLALTLAAALQPPGAHQIGDHVAYALLLAWGEALLSGMLFSALVIFAPGTVRTYEQDLYLPARRSPS